jgi:aryl-alcohol dehydrogenase-like predicted oxidoreductase
VRYIGVSNETSYGVMRFAQLAEQMGLPKIVSIQNSYSLLVRTRFHSHKKLCSGSRAFNLHWAQVPWRG